MANNEDKTPIRVLFIDQQRMLAGQIKDIARNGVGIDVVGEFTTIDQALGTIANTKPDVVLLDAESDNGATLERLSEIAAANAISRILVLAKNVGNGLSERALLDGAHGVVKRTIPTETLLTVVRKVHEGEMWFDRMLMSRILSRADKRNCGSAQETAPADILTKRERDITRLIASGLANKDIALRLGLSEKTVRNHLSTIYSKLGLTNRLELGLLASKNGFGT